jgi:HAD superfamily hydrolase (TIGR01509 family)
MIFKAAIFDMDGVIVDSNPFHVKSLRQYCDKMGFHLSEEYIRTKIFGRTNHDWITDLLAGEATPEKVRFHSREKEKRFRKIFEPSIRPVEGLITLLENLKEKNILCAVATSAISENVSWVLDKTDTGKYFDVVVDESFISNSKPHPEIYQKTAELLSVLPQNCVVFEDSFSGIQSAKEARCKIAAVTTTHSAEEFEKVDLIIKNFCDLDVEKLSNLFEGEI